MMKPIKPYKSSTEGNLENFANMAKVRFCIRTGNEDVLDINNT